MKCVCEKQGCNGLCDVATALRLAVLIGKTDKECTRMGEKATPSCGVEYTYCGVAIDADDGVSRICKRTKDYKCLGESDFIVDPEKMLSQFTTSDIGSIESIKESARKLSCNEMVITPIKVKTDVALIGDRNSHGRIKTVTAKTGPDGKLVQTVGIRTATSSGIYSTVRKPITEYCETFAVDVAENMRKNNKYGKVRLIQLTNTGFIRPIEITDGEVAMLIDGVSVYARVGEETRELFRIADKGKSSNEKEIAEEIAKAIPDEKFSRIVECMADNYKYICSHKKWIAPVRTAETFKVDISK